MDVPGSIAAASMHADEPARSKSYLLAGLVFSGFGTLGASSGKPAPTKGTTDFYWPKDAKDDVTSGKVNSGMSDPKIYKQIEALGTTMIAEELASVGPKTWFEHRKEYACKIRVPMMARMAEHDHRWHSTAESVHNFLDGFRGVRSAKVQLSLGSPHCTELSYAGKG